MSQQEALQGAALGLLDRIDRRQNLTEVSVLKTLRDWEFDLSGKKVLDLGCSDGGGTFAFAMAGATARGVELDPLRVDAARGAEETIRSGAEFQVGNALEAPRGADDGWADLVVLQEVVEHVPDLEGALASAYGWAKDGGYCYVSFPPYFSPVGGHHHYARAPFRFMPWLHLLLPVSMLLKTLPDDEDYREEVRTINQITIARFERVAERLGWKIEERQADIVRPSISLKMGLPIVSGNWLGSVPLLREMFLTGVQYLLVKK
jgi:SAM-dependent methyltransferase